MDVTFLQTLATWAQGELRGDGTHEVRTVCTDSRQLAAGDLFVALRGEKFDGHAFVAQAAQLGAAGAVVDFNATDLPENFPVIRVRDTLVALQEIARAYRKSLPLRVVAITGSNGKTSTKDFTAGVLSERFSVTKTQGNFNNHIGLPLSILRASRGHDLGVFELGMNHPGEIAPLAELAQPEVGIITSVGVAHLEFMKTRDAIAQEKGMLAEAVPPTGCVVLCAEDDYTTSIAQRSRARTILAGIEGGEVRAIDIHHDAAGSRFTLVTSSEQHAARLRVPGQHMIRNALLAVATGTIFGLTLAECAAGLEEVELTGGRLQHKEIRGLRILDDSYNANPDSMVAALRTLAQMPTHGRRFAVLGRMGELGETAAEAHRKVGAAAARERIDVVIAVGDEAALIAEGAGAGEAVADAAEAARLLRERARPGDLVLVKGSRSARMERVLEELAR